MFSQAQDVKQSLFWFCCSVVWNLSKFAGNERKSSQGDERFAL
ncbi:MAG: hypothetical protein ACJA1E_000887 [Paracoccaceae bacterium]|jgi:hypothetical protein